MSVTRHAATALLDKNLNFHSSACQEFDYLPGYNETSPLCPKDHLLEGNVLASSDNASNVNFESISLLIPKVKDGDSEARDNLLNELRGFLSLVANENLYGTLKQKIGASDIVQLSMLRVVENFEKFDGSTEAELRPWLRKIVINEIRRTLRSYKTGKRDFGREQSIDASSSATQKGIPDGNLTPSSEAIAAERIELFQNMLHELAPEHAEVIHLRSIMSLSFKEIGESMNRSEDAASKLWYRAMLKLEERLIESGNFDSQ